MQLSNLPRPFSPKLDQKTEFTFTILDEKTLLVRLANELRGVLEEMRWSVNQLRENPTAFLHSLSLQALDSIRRQLTATNLLGFTSALLVIASLVLLVIKLDTRREVENQASTTEEDSIDRPVLLVMTKTGVGPTTIYPPSIGRVGLSSGRGEGSAPTPSRASGGGSGGMGDLTPPQIGKIPAPSLIPAVIPKDPPTTTPTLPAAGVDLDPLLWADIKLPVYGDPHSQSTIPSNGPGEDGGMGTRKGFGVGDGNGNGYGRGNNGNTGGGERGLGYGGDGGAAGGGGAYDGPFLHSKVDQKVRLLSKPEPHYTEEARRNQITGTVVLRVVFSYTGQITNIRALQPLPFGLTERAIAAAREIKFMPATIKGRPVSVYIQLEYNFNLY